MTVSSSLPVHLLVFPANSPYSAGLSGQSVSHSEGTQPGPGNTEEDEHEKNKQKHLNIFSISAKETDKHFVFNETFKIFEI